MLLGGKIGTTPCQIGSAPGFPVALQVRRIPDSSFRRVRYFVAGKYIRRSASPKNKLEAMAVAKKLCDSGRPVDRLGLPKHASLWSGGNRSTPKYRSRSDLPRPSAWRGLRLFAVIDIRLHSSAKWYRATRKALRKIHDAHFCDYTRARIHFASHC